MIVGYATTKCMVDKPCGVVSLSTELVGKVDLLLLRDVTRGQCVLLGLCGIGDLVSKQECCAPRGQHQLPGAVRAPRAVWD